jgi:hypothetical protein
MRKLCIIITFLIPFYVSAQEKAHHPLKVQQALQLAGKNRIELENAITHFKKSNDSLKLKAIYFLIANMPAHFGADYFWKDITGKRIHFNELEYPNFVKATEAFDSLKLKHQKLSPVSFIKKDIETLTADFLIDNVNRAFKAWQNGSFSHITFDEFCEYILPYRASIEPVQNWREAYEKQFLWIGDSIRKHPSQDLIALFATNFKKQFTNTYSFEKRTDPIPRLGALQLLQRRKGPCEDIADLEIFTLRSQGIPATLDIVPYWATSFGSHFFNTVYQDGKYKAFDATASDDAVKMTKMKREPAKVIRITYAIQENTLAKQVDLNDIPDNFLRSSNYLDVTANYWETREVNCQLFSEKKQIAYACVFNLSRWRPIWWGKVKQSRVSFSNMPKGVVYLPVFYENKKIIPAGYPVAVGYQHEMELKPDTVNTRSIDIFPEDRYLAFRPGKKYQLFYWDNEWKNLGEKQAEENTSKLVFEAVPQQALLLLVPEYSTKKERPFIITHDQKRIWF